ncbi:MAG TPA: response regulator [Planctomycetota bacterium]|nr:response regulator [Planctomycetota bacterium]
MKSRQVLIVEDSRNLAFLAAEALKVAGYRVLVAYDGLTAVGLIRRERPDLVLLDVGLPGMDGVLLSGLLREWPALQEPPVILMSACPRDELQQKAEEVGAVDVLPKPFPLSRLVEKVRRWAPLDEEPQRSTQKVG